MDWMEVEDVNDIEVFDSDEFGSIRALVNESGEPMFVAKDVCDALGLNNVGQAIKALDEDEKNSITISDGTPGNPNKAIVTEPGFYRLVLKSRKPEAKAFQRWVTHEVLPALRREGGYMAARTDETPEETMARAVLLAQRTIERQRRRVAELEARNAAIEPKAGFFDACMDGERWQSFTEVSRLFHQYDRTMTRKRMFELAQADGMITRDKQATRLAIDRGYFRNYQAPAYFDQTTGEQVRPRPYAKFTDKGVRWALSRWLGKTATE